MTQHTPEPEYPQSIISNLATLIVADLTDIMPFGTDECDSMKEDIDAAIRKAEKIVENVKALGSITPEAELIQLRQEKMDLLEALEYARKFLGSTEVHLKWPRDLDYRRDALNVVTAAIAKATETP